MLFLCGSAAGPVPRTPVNLPHLCILTDGALDERGLAIVTINATAARAFPLVHSS